MRCVALTLGTIHCLMCFSLTYIDLLKLSSLGIRVFKIHPETISFNTVFTATEDLIQTESVWRVYPNPTSNNFTLESEEQLDWIKIYDLTGKLIYTNNAPQFSNEIPLDQAGVYIVQVGGKNSISIQKMVRL